MASTIVVIRYTKTYASHTRIYVAEGQQPPSLPSSHEGWGDPDNGYEVESSTTPETIPDTAVPATPELMAQYQLTAPDLPAPTEAEDGTVAPDGLSARHVWWEHVWVHQGFEAYPGVYLYEYQTYLCEESYVVYIDTAAESPEEPLPVPIIAALLLLALLMAAAGSVTGNHQANKAHIYRKEADNGGE